LFWLAEIRLWTYLTSLKGVKSEFEPIFYLNNGSASAEEAVVPVASPDFCSSTLRIDEYVVNVSPLDYCSWFVSWYFLLDLAPPKILAPGDWFPFTENSKLDLKIWAFLLPYPEVWGLSSRFFLIKKLSNKSEVFTRGLSSDFSFLSVLKGSIDFLIGLNDISERYFID
jgi:hypothetical protein